MTSEELGPLSGPMTTEEFMEHLDMPDAMRSGTQTDDGAVPVAGAFSDWASPEDAAYDTPSSPDRIEAGVSALMQQRPVIGSRHAVEVVAAALDAYDREHPSPEVAAFRHWRDSMAADLPDEYREDGAAVEVGIEDCYVDGIAALSEVADLRERLAAEVEAACAHPTMGYSVCPACRSAARIVRGGA